MSIELVARAASALGPLTADVVFLGGASIPIWLTDPRGRPPRVTYDVDVVAEVTTLGEYERFQEQLRRRGFKEDIESGVICRWHHVASELVLDAVPVRHELAGFGGRWLPHATAAGAEVAVEGVTIRAVPPPWLLVLKLEAYASRGRGDVLGSRDFEDIVLLVDGRAELADEVAVLPVEAQAYVRDGLASLLAHPSIGYGVEGALGTRDSYERARDVTLPRLTELTTHGS